MIKLKKKTIRLHSLVIGTISGYHCIYPVYVYVLILHAYSGRGI